MSFPSSPINGQISVVNNISYVYNATLTAWFRNTLTTANVITTDTANIVSTTSSTSTTTGALKVAGGVGIAGNVFVGAIYTDSYFYANGSAITGGAGAAGFTGSSGINGTTGYTGSASTAVGYTGSTGVGFTGSAGVGFTGSTGTTGTQGTIGYTGSTSEATSVTVSPVFKGALVSANSTQTPGASTWTTLTNFDSIAYDTNSFRSVADRFTIPAGVTKVKLSGSLLGESATDQFICRITKNGSPTYSSVVDIDSLGQDGSVAVTPVLEVVAGDYFEFQGYSQTASRSILAGITNWFAIEVVEGSILDTTSVIRTTGYTGSIGVGYTGSAGTGGGGSGNGYTGSQGIPGTLASGTVTNTFTGNGTATAYTMTVAPVGIDATILNIDGVVQQKSTYTVSGYTLTLSEPALADELIEVTILTYGTTNFVTRTYTGNGSTATYTVTLGTTVDSVVVTENGIVQTPATDYTINSATLTFATAPAAGVAISIREIPAGAVGGNSIYSRTAITATAGQTTFAVAYNIGFLEVYFNGALLNSVDYTATNGSTVVLTDAAAVDDIVEFITYNVVPVTAVPVAMFNSTNLTANLAITAGYSAVSVGPISIADGVAVSIASGQKWVIL